MLTGPLVCRGLTIPAKTPFPSPAHRSGRADLPHPALIRETHASAHGKVRVSRGRRTSPNPPLMQASDIRGHIDVYRGRHAHFNCEATASQASPAGVMVRKDNNRKKRRTGGGSSPGAALHSAPGSIVSQPYRLNGDNKNTDERLGGLRSQGKAMATTACAMA